MKIFQLFGDFDINVSDVLEVFSAISRHSRSNGALEIRSQEAKDILASEKGSNLVNTGFPCYSRGYVQDKSLFANT